MIFRVLTERRAITLQAAIQVVLDAGGRDVRVVRRRKRIGWEVDGETWRAAARKSVQTKEGE